MQHAVIHPTVRFSCEWSNPPSSLSQPFCNAALLVLQFEWATYEAEMASLAAMTGKEAVAMLRRKSTMDSMCAQGFLCLCTSTFPMPAHTESVSSAHIGVTACIEEECRQSDIIQANTEAGVSR